MFSFSIIHFNDVYNIEPCTTEPTGGAARLSGYVKSFQNERPLILFSGDVLNPSLMSIFLKGEQMIPVLNGVGVNCAVYGNHDFDFGVDHLNDLTEQTHFPWLISNVTDNLNHEPLANGERTHMIETNGIKVGLVGLVEEEWIETLATLDPEDVTYIDYVEAGRKYAAALRKQGADIIIALTHMRWPNDTRLAEEVEDIDLILGGHDHDYLVTQINGKYVVKSGTDFRNLSHIYLMKEENSWKININRVDLDSSVREDPEIRDLVIEKLAQVDDKMDNKLGDMLVELDGRFSKVRTQETNLGNFVTDVILTATNAEVALLNSGTLRSDRIHPRGEFKIRDLLTILPLVDNLVVIKVTGKQIIDALENGVSQYPKLEGRFPQVSGIQFGFDPSKARGHRVDPDLVKVQGEYLELDRDYRLCTKEYIANGKDGYECFKNCEILVTSETCPTLSTCVQNHFESVQILHGDKECRSGHRQSLLCLVKKYDLTHQSSHETRNPLVRQRSIHEAEEKQRLLSPMVEGRIIVYDDEVSMTIAQFYIIYDQNEGVCSAGNQLTGKIILKTVKPMDIKRVCIYFEGKAKSHWEVSKDDSHKCYKTKEFYIDDNKILFDRAFNGAPLLPAGLYTYPFSYHISRTFPSSFEGSKGYIRYACKAVIEKEKRYKTEEIEKSFSVIHHLDLNYHPAARDPGIVQHEESVDFCCCDEGSVFLQLKIEKSGFVPGELLHFIADCHNNSSRDIDKIYLDLLQNVTYKGYSVNVFSSGNPKYHTKTTPFELYESTRGVERHKYTSIKNSVRLPPMPPSKLEGCSIITTAYELRLKANIGAGVSCSMFITIGTVPLRERVNRGPIITRSTALLPQSSAAISAKNVHPIVPRTDAPPSYEECVLGQSSIDSRSQTTAIPTTSTTDQTTCN